MKLQRYLVESEERILRYGPLVWRELKKNCKPFLKEFKKTEIKGKGKLGQFWIWRGADKGISTTPGYKEIKPRGNRMPKDMPGPLHNKLDDEFYSKFGWHARSQGVFTTSNRRTAAGYGKPYIFFPTGHYEYIWSPQIEDLFTFAEREGLINYDYEAYYDSFELEMEWRDEWGENTYNGRWEYDGEEVCDYKCSREEAGDEVMSDIGEDDYDPLSLEWIPDIDLDEFTDRKNAEDLERIEGEIEDGIKSYTDKNLKGAIKSGHEIMFNCRSYYLIHESYSDFLQSMISIGSYQYKLPFPHDYLELSKFGKPKFWIQTKGGELIHSG